MNLLKRGTLRFDRQFMDDTGTAADPTSPFAELRKPDGTWVALSAPTKQNGKTGLFGFTLDMSNATTYPVGQYAVRIGGTVATAKAPARVDEFYLSEYSWDDIMTQLSSIMGAGFLSSTDSLEAIRDRGDLAWTTGVGAAADKFYAPSGAIVPIAGTLASGTYADLAAVDGTYVTFNETAGVTPGIDFYVPIQCALDEHAAYARVWAWYSGNGTHWMTVQAAVDGNPNGSWEDVGTIPNGTAISAYQFSLTPQHISHTTGLAYLRFKHNAVAGNGTHVFRLDKVLLAAQTPMVVNVPEPVVTVNPTVLDASERTAIANAFLTSLPSSKRNSQDWPATNTAELLTVVYLLLKDWMNMYVYNDRYLEDIANQVQFQMELGGTTLTLIRQLLSNKWAEGEDGTITIYDDDMVTVLGTMTWDEATKVRGALTTGGN